MSQLEKTQEDIDTKNSIIALFMMLSVILLAFSYIFAIRQEHWYLVVGNIIISLGLSAYGRIRNRGNYNIYNGFKTTVVPAFFISIAEWVTVGAITGFGLIFWFYFAADLIGLFVRGAVIESVENSRKYGLMNHFHKDLVPANQNTTSPIEHNDRWMFSTPPKESTEF